MIACPLPLEEPHNAPSFVAQARSPTSADTLFQEWNVAANQIWLTLEASSLTWAAGPSDPHVEHLASELLHQGRGSFADIDKLLDLLPEKSSAKRRDRLCEQLLRQKCFSTGAFTLSRLGHAGEVHGARSV